ncbi:HupE/UreJ family protein [Synechococcus sp. BIOS-U3-1]|uniref:HupE/UreJ family protein n=1 Tax=Synechococcus sp. BIOS-U3-1 TaxID=1400865 RepID=UPI0016440079|nr:HupE/UreJ family protein [Synechococcus sp. BIOS-U3-1]
MRWRWLLLALLLSFLPSAALAHVPEGGAGSVMAGLLHPVTGIDHVVAMVAVGLWGAVLGAPAIWLLPVAFPMVMAFGGVMGLLDLPLPGVETGIALSALVLGVMVMLQQRLPLALAAGLVGLCALFHGYAHGVELPDGADALLFSLAFVGATGLLHLVGIGLGEARRLAWGHRLLQVVGAVIAVVGVWSLIQAGAA